MTIDIDAIRQLTDAATEEPWFAVVQRGKVPVVATTDQALAVCGSPGRGAGKNAEFIAAARTHVPDLCDEVEQLRAERDRMKPVVEAAKSWAEALTGPVEPRPEAEALYRAVQALPNDQEPCDICSGYGCPDCREDGA